MIRSFAKLNVRGFELKGETRKMLISMQTERVTQLIIKSQRREKRNALSFCTFASGNFSRKNASTSGWKKPLPGDEKRERIMKLDDWKKSRLNDLKWFLIVVDRIFTVRYIPAAVTSITSSFFQHTELRQREFFNNKKSTFVTCNNSMPTD